MKLAEIQSAARDRQQQVARLSAQNVRITDIAAALGVTYRTVERDRAATGVSKPPPRPWTAQEHHRAMELLVDGASLREVADTVGRTYTSVCHRFQGMGWTGETVGEYNRLRKLAERVFGS